MMSSHAGLRRALQVLVLAAVAPIPSSRAHAIAIQVVAGRAARPGEVANACLDFAGQGKPVAGVQADITWDPSCAELAGKCVVNAGHGKNVTSNLRRPGVLSTILLSFSDSSPIPDRSELFCCPFRVTASPCPVALQNVIMSDPGGTRLSADNIAGAQLTAGEQGSETARGGGGGGPTGPLSVQGGNVPAPAEGPTGGGRVAGGLIEGRPGRGGEAAPPQVVYGDSAPPAPEAAATAPAPAVAQAPGASAAGAPAVIVITPAVQAAATAAVQVATVAPAEVSPASPAAAPKGEAPTPRPAAPTRAARVATAVPAREEGGGCHCQIDTGTGASAAPLALVLPALVLLLRRQRRAE